MYKYCGVKFNRGTGLGNRLFPWARCVLYAQQQHLPMLWPNWFHIRKASFLKGGIDYRTSLGKILLYNNFKPSAKYIQNIQKKSIKLTNDHEIKWFNGDGNFFSDLYDFHPLIKTELQQIAHPSIVSTLNQLDAPSIILNIRRGKDFLDAKVEADYINKGAIRTPLSWFISSLAQIREVAGHDVPALIISDGNMVDLKEVLALPNTSLARTKTAMADLLLMQNAKVILGSGGSSFTAWGSFLSKAVTLTIPGQSLQWFNITNDISTHYVGTYNPLSPELNILKLINEKL